MRPTHPSWLLAAAFIAVCPLQAQVQNSEVITVGSDKFLRWYGHADRTYFIQISDPNEPLRKWTWAPVIETGNNANISHEVGGTANNGFFRLWFSDLPTNDPEGDDFDYDGLTNLSEVTTHQTNPLMWDTDGDGMSDKWEIDHGLDPNDNGTIDPDNGADGDPDGDGLVNLMEYWYFADPNLADTDGDGLNDYDEAFIHGTWPDVADTDGDGLNDYAEIITHGTEPWTWDMDNDTLSDGDEVLTHGTNPKEMDTDGDWMWDDYEIANNLDPTDAADGLLDADGDTLANKLEFVFMDKGYNPVVANNAAVFPWSGDPDGDELDTQIEFVTHQTNPRQPDTDGDGMNDGWELANGFNAKLNNRISGPANHHPDADPDGDGLTNAEEEQHATKPNNADSDGDGVDDKTEITQGTDPNDPNDKDPPPNGTVPVTFTFGDHSDSHSEKYKLWLKPLEGDTHGNRYRTNRDYGVTEVRIIRLPKGAKYKVELEHIGTDKKHRGPPNPDYDYTLEVDDSANGITVHDPDTIMGIHDEGYSYHAEGKHSTLYVPLFKVKEVSFSNSTVGDLTDDGKLNAIGDAFEYKDYDAPHWQDGNDDGDADDAGERKFPIAYVQATPPTIAGKIMVKPSGLTSISGFSAKIKVTGPGNVKIDPPVAAVVGADELELIRTASSGNFVNEIDYMNPMILSWEVEVRNQGEWCEAGECANRTYITLDAPATSMRQESLFDIGSRNAAGANLPIPAFESMWPEFEDRVVSRVDPATGSPTRDPSGMIYWKPGGNDSVPVDKFLVDGDGSCGTWADFMIEVVKANGISSAVISAVEAPKPVNYANVVNPYKTYAGFTGNVYWESLDGLNGGNVPTTLTAGDRVLKFKSNNGDVSDGIFFVKQLNLGNSDIVAIPPSNAGFPNSASEAQGNPNARAWFGNHGIVKFNNKYYDPSYGGTPKATKIDWEDNALQYFGGWFGVFESDGQGGFAPLEALLWKERPDPKGTLETNINP